MVLVIDDCKVDIARFQRGDDGTNSRTLGKLLADAGNELELHALLLTLARDWQARRTPAWRERVVSLMLGVATLCADVAECSHNAPMWREYDHLHPHFLQSGTSRPRRIPNGMKVALSSPLVGQSLSPGHLKAADALNRKRKRGQGSDAHSLHPKSLAKVEFANAYGYFLVGRALSAESGAFSISMDACRAGGEEIMSFALVAFPTGQPMWLPPQAISRFPSSHHTTLPSWGQFSFGGTLGASDSVTFAPGVCSARGRAGVLVAGWLRASRRGRAIAFCLRSWDRPACRALGLGARVANVRQLLAT